MRKTALSAFAAATLACVAGPAAAQEPFVGEVQWFGMNFCPVGWANANGQLLAISENDVLFALIGTTYGGDGQQTFALPDLRSRMPLHQGTGGGATYVIGQTAGAESKTLTTNQIPAHNHTVNATAKLRASSSAGDTAAPGGAVLANGGTTRAYATGPANVDMGPSLTSTFQTASAGQSSPQRYNNVKPYLTLTPCIATQGIFPSRP
jgi:microcystin-dependent protein